MDYKALVAQGKYVGGRMDSGLEREVVFALCDAVEALEREVKEHDGVLAVWRRRLTDEENAHKLTAETLTKAIRDGDKAEQYRVERDKARAEVKALEKELQDERGLGKKFDPTIEYEAPCVCGHPYYRHFDTYDDMAAVGCKYCECREFTHTASSPAPTASTPTPAAPSDA